MKEQLELKHLAPYSPYGLKIKDCLITKPFVLDAVNLDSVLSDIEHLNTISLILRPLSDLTKEIEHNSEKFVPIIELAKLFHTPSKYTVTHYGDIKDYGYVGIKVNCYVEKSNSRYSEFSIHSDELILHNDYRIVQKLIEWHFDVFDLHSKGLCIYYNEL